MTLLRPSVARQLQQLATDRPDDVAFRFLTDPRRPWDEAAGHTRTYRQLHERARALAAALVDMASPGDRVLLLFHPGADYVEAFYACQYAGMTAVPAYPPQRASTVDRLRSLIRDAGPSVYATTGALLARWSAQDGELRDAGAPLITDDNDAIVTGGRDLGRESSLAFLQYTSGSTGDPRGVMVTQDNLTANLTALSDRFATTEDDHQFSWLPPYHDMGLIAGILQPIYAGVPVTLTSPFAFIVDPLCWLTSIGTLGITYSGGPDFAYALCTAKVPEEAIEALDLRSWRIAFCGAEPIRTDTASSFAARFAPAGFSPRAFLPGYGLAESTLIVSGRRPDEVVRLECGDDSEAPFVCLGGPVDGMSVAVVDPATSRVLPDRAVGEIWVGGDSVCAGYWGRPEESASTFDAASPDLPWPALRTGDLGFQVDGELYVCGRIKDLIIIRGQNHYPQDIERTVHEVDSVLRSGCGAAFTVQGPAGDDQLVVVQEADGALDADEERRLRTDVQRAVSAGHSLDLHSLVLIAPKTIPKTSSGKIRRHATRAAYLSGELAVLEPAVSQPVIVVRADVRRSEPATTPQTHPIPLERNAR
jgi:acyl-CoA synthetase (AMP-forming)/AMP-acid ligase II